MLANYFAAALRNLARNRLHSAITIASLAIGFAAVIFASLYGRYEHGYDRFWPNAERLYMATSRTTTADGVTLGAQARASRAAMIAGEVSGVEAAARLAYEEVKVEIGAASYQEGTAFWADPNLFEVLEPKVLAGDLAALADPGSVVLSKSHAEKYFGSADPIGRTIQVVTEDRDVPLTLPLRVGAVIADFPRQGHLNESALYMSGRSQAAPLGDEDLTLTYFRVRPGMRKAALDAAFADLTRRHLPPQAGTAIELQATPIGGVYMLQALDFNFGPGTGSMIREGYRANIWLFGILAGLILTVASVNFITLMTARGAGRAVEVGVRKASGARRRDLVLQFMGEAVLYAVMAFLAAVALTELLLPAVNRLTSQAFKLDYLADAPFLLRLGLGAVIVGAIAGAYPALALSSFKPASVLKGGLVKTPGSALLRKILISAQFVPLIFLAAFAVMVHLSTFVVARNSLSLDDPDGLYIMEACNEPFRARLAALPGVRSAACVIDNGFSMDFRYAVASIGGRSNREVRTADGRDSDVQFRQSDRDELAFHDLELLAGRMWSSPADEGGVVVTETAARALGFARPSAAVGQSLPWSDGDERRTSPIIGVTADRGGYPGLESVVYFMDPATKRERVFGVKLSGADFAPTLAAIDKAWLETGALRPLERRFYRDLVAERVIGMQVMFGMISACVAIGVIVAVLGLFGLAAFLAQQRTKEVGIRKALGADRSALMRMLMLQFSGPVIIANLVGLPLAFAVLVLIANTVLQDRSPTTGPQAAVLVLVGSFLLAVLATFGHAWRVTSARPVTALRYE